MTLEDCIETLDLACLACQRVSIGSYLKAKGLLYCLRYLPNEIIPRTDFLSTRIRFKWKEDNTEAYLDFEDDGTVNATIIEDGAYRVDSEGNLIADRALPLGDVSHLSESWEYIVDFPNGNLF